jgi:hypothetical protein
VLAPLSAVEAMELPLNKIGKMKSNGASSMPKTGDEPIF